MHYRANVRMPSSAWGAKRKDRVGLERVKLDIGQLEGVSQFSVVEHACEAGAGGSKFKDCLAIQ